jgi:23S rRNA pseudoU1915 N3-methylase RlmH
MDVKIYKGDYEELLQSKSRKGGSQRSIFERCFASNGSILAKISQDTHVVALAMQGKMRTSEELAEQTSNIWEK